jgi:hypothetical protein
MLRLCPTLCWWDTNVYLNILCIYLQTNMFIWMCSCSIKQFLITALLYAYLTLTLLWSGIDQQLLKKLERNTYPQFRVVYTFLPIPPYVEIMHGFPPHPRIHYSHTSANNIKLRNFTVCDSWDDNSKMNFTTEIQKYVHLFPCTTLFPTREKRWYICVLLNHMYNH